MLRSWLDEGWAVTCSSSSSKVSDCEALHGDGSSAVV